MPTKEFFILRQVDTTKGDTPATIVEATPNPMCPRCREYEPVTKDDLCQRCVDAV